MKLLWLAALSIAAGVAAAHEPSRSLLTLNVDAGGVGGRIEVSLRDLEDAVGLDADGDAAIAWGEVRQRWPEIARYVLAHVELTAGGAACTLAARGPAVATHGGAAYAAVTVRGACAAPGALAVESSLLAGVDTAHRGLLQLAVNGHAATAVLSAERPSFAMSAGAQSRGAGFRRFVAEGAVHIWQGYDHLAFLALLVLPVMLGTRGQAPAAARAAVWRLAGIVTAFTAAHSITLGLAALGVVTLPRAGVEIVVALSVLAAALLNLWPRLAALGWRLAFGFGLVHGLGFANALADLGTTRGAVLSSLAGFNAGVELGQLAIVAAALPVLLALRCLPGRALVVPASSAACAALALMWVAERL